MYFDELELGMSVDTAPALIEKEKMLFLPKLTITFLFIQTMYKW